MADMRFVFPTDDPVRYRFPTHGNDLVMDRAESEVSEVFVVLIEEGKAPPPHVHDDTEQVFFVLEGRGVLQAGTPSTSHAVKQGDVVRIPARTRHSIRAEGGPLRYLAIDCFLSPGARLEPTWDEHVRVLCRAHGWRYEDVIERKASPGPSRRGG